MRAAGVAPDHPHVRKSPGRAAIDVARDRARGVGAVFDRACPQRPESAGCSRLAGRMDVDDGLATLELRKHRIELRIAQPAVAVAGEQPTPCAFSTSKPYSISFSAPSGVLQLDVGEEAEAARDVAHRSWPRIRSTRASACAPARLLRRCRASSAKASNARHLQRPSRPYAAADSRHSSASGSPRAFSTGG